jgi:hypothetical protein
LANEYYQDPLDGELRQGDIFECGPHLHIDVASGALPPNGEQILLSGPPCRGAPALLLNHDCEIVQEKSSRRLVICPIKPLSELREDRRGNAKKNRIAHLLFLPRYKDRLVDSVAILNQLTTVQIDRLLPIHRLATLDVLGRKAMYAQYLRWISRWVLAEMECPNCGSTFDPTLVLPVRAPTDP